MAEQDLLRAENASLRDRVRLLELQLAQQSPTADPCPANVVKAPRASRPVQSETAEAHHNSNAYTAGGSAKGALLAGSDADVPALIAPSIAASQSASMAQQGVNGAAAGGSRQGVTPQASAPLQWSSTPHGLSQKQVGRYSRQLMLPSFGVEGAPSLWAKRIGLRTHHTDAALLCGWCLPLQPARAKTSRAED